MNKETNDLIKILAQSPPAQKPLSFGLILMLLTLASLGITFAVLGQLRPEFSTLTLPLGFYIKTVILLGFAFFGFSYLKDSAKPLPAIPHHRAVLILPIFLAVMVVAEWVSIGSRAEITNLFLLPNFAACLFFVTSYGLAGIVALTALMRQYAPADEHKAAGLIGFAAGASCAVGYSFHCGVDSPTFIAVAYGLPLAALYFLARIFVPKFIRW